MAGGARTDARTGKNGRPALVGLLRQSVFGRPARYEDVYDAGRLRHDPAMRWIGGGKAASGAAASSSQMGRLRSGGLTAEWNLAVRADLSGQWIDRVHCRVGYREASCLTWTRASGPLRLHCYHSLFLLNQFGDLERRALRPGKRAQQ